MNDAKTDRTPPWDTGGEGESIGFGRWLRRQRELREIPLREIADVTKISLRYLEALEQERFDILPAPVFAKGFLRQYSRYVGLDGDEVVNSFLIATGELTERGDEESEVRERETRSGGSRTRVIALLAVLAIVAIVVAIGLVSRMRTEEGAPSSSSMAAPIPVPVVARNPVEEEETEPPSAEVSTVPLTVTIDFTEDCWMEAIVDDDRTISELRVQGESMRLEANERVLLTLGNPTGVRVEVNGVPFEFAYSPNRIVRNLEIDLPLAEALRGGES